MRKGRAAKTGRSFDFPAYARDTTELHGNPRGSIVPVAPGRACPHQRKQRSPMKDISRRSFMIFSLGAGSALWLSQARADSPHLGESDPAAVAVGYKEDAAKVDKAKYSNYAAGQTCANCSLFQGKANDAWGGCTLFPDKLVAGRGWCASYTNM
jgi:hypothetical protein